ncbi:MAG: cytochrome c [Hyphomicrobiaceae bacterium]
MTSLGKSLIAFLIGGSLYAPACAQSPLGDPAAGKTIAAKLCSNCHVTGEGPTGTARADVPAFKAIANRSTTTPERLAAAIILPHPAMPDVPLTRDEIRAVIAYIMSLKK